ncbi:hypothetical protein [Dyella nitratireducens]|uniref:DUF2384 domain-containing protein n=1 Tax=Dyella nitratireducens TaxID=1849580 RepID=A0ABQ1FW05_9GAMM|nr:hypothetical protein [Dyella nitratireducens]GGA30396.1 hypothetical protein GCM10010981_19250 [Dyella nitratireducens]GLQ43012.1 hypothetical protein GCM10007902_28620 [Dyella nitratireducens]
MVFAQRKVANEFLQFLADIYDPATGIVSCVRLAASLGMTEDALLKRWIRRGTRVSWRQFSDELLSVLDVAQAQRRDLEQAIDWYFNCPIEPCGRKTADELVTAGETDRLLRELDTYGVRMHAVQDRARPRLVHGSHR